MPTTNIFHWPDGRGWLILAGDADDDIRARALNQTAADGAIAYVKMNSSFEAGEETMEAMIALGAPSGYLVDVAAEDDQTVVSQLTEAGMVVIESGVSGAESRSVLLGAAAEGIRASYASGGVILAEGFSAMVFGAWVVQDDGTLVPGLEWLQSALLAPGVIGAAEWGRAALLERPTTIAVGIGPGSALALGPDGQVQAWGEGQITVALGRDYIAREGNE